MAVLPPPVGWGHSDVARPAALDAAPCRPDSAIAAANTTGPAGAGPRSPGSLGTSAVVGAGGAGSDGILHLGAWRPDSGHLARRMGSAVLSHDL